LEEFSESPEKIWQALGRIFENFCSILAVLGIR
jgi:hypothetical protein